MLIDEAKICARLTHGIIAQVFDLGVVNNHYYITMEYVEGKDLFQILRKLYQTNTKMPIDAACHIMQEVGLGLNYAHQKTDEEDVTLLTKVQRADISPPTKVRREIPKALEQIVMKALSASPKNRFTTALEFARALSEYLISIPSNFSKYDLFCYIKELFKTECEESRKPKKRKSTLPTYSDLEGRMENSQGVHHGQSSESHDEEMSIELNLDDMESDPAINLDMSGDIWDDSQLVDHNAKTRIEPLDAIQQEAATIQSELRVIHDDSRGNGADQITRLKMEPRGALQNGFKFIQDSSRTPL